jgi:hypothetical protein
MTMCVEEGACFVVACPVLVCANDVNSALRLLAETCASIRHATVPVAIKLVDLTSSILHLFCSVINVRHFQMGGRVLKAA